MFGYVWPIALVVLSNTLYQICAKSIPSDMNPFASITLIYLVGGVASLVLYHVVSHGGNIMREFDHLNWAPFVQGLVVIGLEAGMIYTYRAGWSVATAPVVQSAFVAISLLAVSALLYREPITFSRVIGIIICLVGMYFINK